MQRLFTMMMLCLWAVLAHTPAEAQFYPDYTNLEVNDYAGILPDDVEASLTQTLSALRRDTGVEMTVVTLSRQETYAPDMTLEAFATGLFNHWGVGDATRNDGVMVLVLPTDRAMRLELGAGYDTSWNHVAQRVVDTAFLPAFRGGDYPSGIIAGVHATIDDIVTQHLAGAPAPDDAGHDGGISGSWLWLALLPFGALFFWQRVADWLAARRSCPSCGERGGLSITRKIKRRATRSLGGLGDKTVSCSKCGYVAVSEYTTSRLSSSTGSRSGSFGGGSSSGGGASGRW